MREARDFGFLGAGVSGDCELPQGIMFWSSRRAILLIEKLFLQVSLSIM